MTSDERHIPVMVNEVLTALQPEPGKIFLDGTVGYGGHAQALLKASGSGTQLLGIDRDSKALAAAHEKLKEFGSNVMLCHSTFHKFAEVLDEAEISAVDGMLLDLGVSSGQLDEAERGFSFQSDGPLDMRMDTGLETSAADIVNEWPVNDLADLIYELGEERLSRRYARAIDQARAKARIETTKQLADIILRANPRKGWQRIHPATRTFQALRIAVNEELRELDEFLNRFIPYLRPNGRIAIISYHSLEDRRVKQAFRQAKLEGKLGLLSKKPVVPSKEELESNPRCRSAKLRSAVKINQESL